MQDPQNRAARRRAARLRAAYTALGRTIKRLTDETDSKQFARLSALRANQEDRIQTLLHPRLFEDLD